MKTTFICTVFNEEKTISDLLDSILGQTIHPDEVIIVDGGSTDKTVKVITQWEKTKKLPIILLEKKGNRSVGRNIAIQHAIGDIILISDAGCVLDQKWIENITKPFTDKTVDVVAGYYKGNPKNSFQECLIPYVLVMPDRVNEKSFLPATRSMAIRRRVFDEVGFFNEHFSHNEDFVFANRLKQKGKKIVFFKNAVVSWIPPQSIKKIFIMFYRFALGDSEAGFIRKKVLLLLFRYFIALFLILLFLFTPNTSLMFIIVGAFLLYSIWAIAKNFKYAKKWQACFYFPFLQFLSDIAVVTGTIRGSVKKYGL